MLSPPGVESVRYVRRVLGSDLKMVMTIRDPVDWIISMAGYFARAISSSGIGHVLESDDALEFACFANSFEAWLEVFPASNFLFLCAEDLFNNQSEITAKLFDYLSIDAPTS